jgi:hypothetical protein
MERKYKKWEVDYTPVAKTKDEQCRYCLHFRPIKRECTIVGGTIDYLAWCNKFRKSHDRSDQD